MPKTTEILKTMIVVFSIHDENMQNFKLFWCNAFWSACSSLQREK